VKARGDFFSEITGYWLSKAPSRSRAGVEFLAEFEPEDINLRGCRSDRLSYFESISLLGPYRNNNTNAITE
jgi:hypothetical protein